MAEPKGIDPSKVNYDAQVTARARAMEMGALCDRCVLNNCRRGPVLGEVQPGAKLAIIGEAPGPREVEAGVPFVSASGFLGHALEMGGLYRHECTISNSSLCQPPGDGSYLKMSKRVALQKKRLEAKAAKRLAAFEAELTAAGVVGKEFKRRRVAKKKELAEKVSARVPLLPHEACLPRLKAELAASGASVFLGVGDQGLRALARVLDIPFGRGKKVAPGAPRLLTLGDQHGHPLRLPDGRIVASSYHPAFGFRSKPWIPLIEEDIRRAAELATVGLRWSWGSGHTTMGTYEESVAALEDLLRGPQDDGVLPAVTVDIETDGVDKKVLKITCLGVGVWRPKLSGISSESGASAQEFRVVTVPVRDHGALVYTEEQTAHIRQLIRRLLDTSGTIVGHNVIQFDMPILAQEGYLTDINHTAFDTMLAHHNTRQAEHAHDLGFVAGRVLPQIPMWKLDADAKSIEGAGFKEEGEYNTKDVYATGVMAGPLARMVQEAGMAHTLEIDTHLSRIARDMGDLGLQYDFAKRIEHYQHQLKVYNHWCAYAKNIVNRPGWSPTSGAHLQDWLYNVRKIPPPFVAGGEPFNPEEHETDEGAVDEATLQTVLNGGVPSDVRQVIEAIFRVKAAQKLLGTYIQLRAVPMGDSREEKKLREKMLKDADERRRQVWQLADGTLAVESKTSRVHAEDEYGRRASLPKVMSVEQFIADDKFHLYLHPSFRTHIIPAGRFASTPNVLAWPKEMRAMIVAPKGHVFAGGDAEQIEARLFGLSSNDQEIIDCFLRNIDLHTYNWAGMNTPNKVALLKMYEADMARGGKKNKEVDHCRTIAKGFMYALSYGSEVETMYQTFVSKRKHDGSLAFPGLKRDDVQKWYDGWHKSHPATKLYFERLRLQHEAWGYITSLVDDRRRYMDGGFDRNAAANHPQQCGHRGTMVLTSIGYTSIDNLLKRGASDLMAWTGRVWAPFCVVPKGTARMCRVVLSNGMTLKCSVNHKLRRAGADAYEWVEAKDLLPKDRVAINLAREMNYGAEMNEESAYWLGYYTGNGHYYEVPTKRQIAFSIGERKHAPMRAQVERLTRYLDSHGLAYGEPYKPRADSEMFSVACSSLATVAHFRDLGAIPNENAHTKGVPPRIWAANLAARKAYMRGVLDSDGFFQWDGDGKVEVHLCSEKLVRELHLLGTTIGLDGSIFGPYNSDRKGHIAWSVVFYQQLVHQSLGYPVRDIIRANNLVPSYELDKLREMESSAWRHLSPAALKSAIVLRARARHGGSVGAYQLARLGCPPDFNVASVQEVLPLEQKEEVFTLSVDHPDHAYVAEGFISKNSSAADMMNRSLIAIAKDIPHRGWTRHSGINLQVHDAIYVIVPEQRGREASEIVKAHMTHQIGVMPFPAAVKKHNRRWSEV